MQLLFLRHSNMFLPLESIVSLESYVFLGIFLQKILLFVVGTSELFPRVRQHIPSQQHFSG